MLLPQVDVSDFVSVTVNISPIATPYLLFGLPLIMGDSGVIDTTERLRKYTTLNGIGGDFGSTSPEYLAAEVFFEQSPQPSQCYIGAWARTAQPAILRGATLTALQQVLSNFTAISAGGFLISIGGVPYAVSGVNLSQITNLNGVATALSTALTTPGATVAWDSNNGRFNASTTATGATAAISFASPSTAVGNYAFSGQPADSGDKITINTQDVAFIANGGTPTAYQVAKGTTLAGTLTALATYLNASTDTNLSKFTYVNDGVSKIYAVSKATGTTGNAYTLARTSTVITATSPTGGVATDISALIGWQSTNGGYLSPGIAAEEPVAAVQDAALKNNQWYGVSFAAATQPTINQFISLAEYINASTRTRVMAVTGTNTGILQSAVTDDMFSQLSALNTRRVWMLYCSSNPYACMTLFGREFTVNFDASNSTITLAYKQAPGIVAEMLTEAQFATIQAKGGNVVVAVDNKAQMIWPGQAANGYWIDETHNIDWFANRVQTDMFNLFYGTTTKIPQTDPGTNQMINCAESSCVAAVNNGMAAPGVWNASGFGMLTQGMMLPKGYYVYGPPIATQSQTNRELRIGVPIQIALKLAGAVHQPNIIVNVNR